MRSIAAFASFGIIVSVAASGCGPWPFGEVCDQRNQLLFAGILSESSGPQCTSHDYDDDGHDAAYDQDDRLDRHDNNWYDPADVYPDGPDGSHIGDISWCIVEETGPVDDYDVVYDWSCIRDYWADRLDELCEAWEDGTFDLEEHSIDSLDEAHYQREADAYEEYCT